MSSFWIDEFKSNSRNMKIILAFAIIAAILVIVSSASIKSVKYVQVQGKSFTLNESILTSSEPVRE